ncbi:MAG: hypothetical protein QME66_06390 [Candidatus Eisenbacteria bacterium]|nr:hypothetical protein [Candidatus Eisenbacteria bacterium]
MKNHQHLARTGWVMTAILLGSLLLLSSSAFPWVRPVDGNYRGDRDQTVGQGDIWYGDPDMPQGKGPGAENPFGAPVVADSKSSSGTASFVKKGDGGARKQLGSPWLEIKLASRFWVLYLVQR